MDGNLKTHITLSKDEDWQQVSWNKPQKATKQKGVSSGKALLPGPGPGAADQAPHSVCSQIRRQPRKAAAALSERAERTSQWLKNDSRFHPERGARAEQGRYAVCVLWFSFLPWTSDRLQCASNLAMTSGSFDGTLSKVVTCIQGQTRRFMNLFTDFGETLRPTAVRVRKPRPVGRCIGRRLTADLGGCRV